MLVVAAGLFIALPAFGWWFLMFRNDKKIK